MFLLENHSVVDDHIVMSHQCDNSMMGANEQDDDMMLYNELFLMPVLLISKCWHSFQPIF